MPQQDDKIKKNIQNSHDASRTSRYIKGGLSEKRVKLNSKNFDRLMEHRGLSEEQKAALKASTKKGTQMQVCHARAGEKFVTTHGTERSSGVFVSERSLGKTPNDRIDKGALPHSNTAEYETTIELSKDQNLVYGKIAPQSKFSKMDPNQVPRTGGGEQVITDGGYNSGAVINRDPKYPVPASSDFKKRTSEYKSQHSSVRLNSGGNEKGNKTWKGQSM